MKIQIEPVRLREMISTALIAKGKTPLLESTVAEFTPTRVSFKDVSYEEIIVHATYLKDYFTSFEAEVENIPVSKFLLKKLEEGFKKDEQITFTNDGDHIVLTGTAENGHYRERMPDIETDPEKRAFPLEMKSTPYGVLREDSLPIEEHLQAMIQIPVNSLSFPTADKYLFTSDGKNLRITVQDEISDYSRNVMATTVLHLSNELSVFFDSEHWSRVISNLEGEVWLGIHPDMAVFSQLTKTSAVTIMMTSREI